MQGTLDARLARPRTLPSVNPTNVGIVVGMLSPLVLAGWLLAHPAFNRSAPEVPWEHLFIVGGASLMALVLAGFLLVSSVRIKHYKVLFLSYGFVAYGGFSAIHALTTPGLLLPDDDTLYSIPGAAAYMALFFAALFFALAQTRVAGVISSRLPFLPIGWFVVTISSLMAVFIGLAVYQSATLARIPLAEAPYSTAVAVVTISLFIYAAWQYLREYVEGGVQLELQLRLGLAMLLFAEAQLIITASTVWSWSWWSYHLLAFAATGVALRHLLLARFKGVALRGVVEDALSLAVSVKGEVMSANALAALSAAIEARDNETAGHNERVANLAVRIGRTMDLPNDRLRILAHAGLLHDIGKLAIPDGILRKPGALDSQERAVMQTHPLRGLDILGKMGAWEGENAAITAHHERIDGSGYPYGLAGEAISMEARIIAVVDTYDAIVSDRPYRRGRTPKEAFEELRAESGKTLDAACVEALIGLLTQV